MPEGVGYGPQNTASVGLSLNVIGDHLYGFSGAVAVSNSAITLIEDTTGNYYTVATWIGNYNQAASESVASEDYRFVLTFNGLRIASCEGSDAQGAARNTLLDIVIPPFTNVKIVARNYSGSGTEDVGAVLVGRIYK